VVSVSKETAGQTAQRDQYIQQWIQEVQRQGKLVEAPHDTIIKLTDVDVREGVPGDPANCAFTLAARRTLGRRVRFAIFYRTTAYIDVGRTVMRYRTDTEGGPARPGTVRYAVEAVDRGEDPEPGEYVLYTVGEHETLAWRREHGKRYPSMPARYSAPKRLDGRRGSRDWYRQKAEERRGEK
jgi:hypothetical protein